MLVFVLATEPEITSDKAKVNPREAFHVMAYGGHSSPTHVIPRRTGFY